MPYVLQGGLGLPDRDYYVSPAPRWSALRAAYGQHVATVLRLMGVADAERRAKGIIDLETRMAAVHATRVQSADVSLPQVWTRETLAAKAPGLDWPALLEAAGLQGAPAFTVWHPAAVSGLAGLVGGRARVWKDWLAFHTSIDHGYLPKRCPRRLRLLRQDAERHAGAQRPAGSAASTRPAGRSARWSPRLRRAPIPARAKARCAPCRRPAGVQPSHRRAGMENPREGTSECEGVGALRRRRSHKWIATGRCRSPRTMPSHVLRAELFEYRRQLASWASVDRTDG